MNAIATKGLLTPVGRLSYPVLFTPKPNDSGQLKYSCTLIFDAAAQALPEFQAMKAAVNATAKEYFGDKLNDETFRKSLKNPFIRSAEHTSSYDIVEGKKVYKAGHDENSVFIRCSANDRPGVVDGNMQKIIDPSEIYPGCFARLQVNAFCYGNKPEHKGNKGVSFGLNHVQKARDGESIGGRGNVEGAFTPLAEAAGAATETAGKSADSVFG